MPPACGFQQGSFQTRHSGRCGLCPEITPNCSWSGTGIPTGASSSYCPAEAMLGLDKDICVRLRGRDIGGKESVWGECPLLLACFLWGLGMSSPQSECTSGPQSSCRGSRRLRCEGETFPPQSHAKKPQLWALPLVNQTLRLCTWRCFSDTLLLSC